MRARLSCSLITLLDERKRERERVRARGKELAEKWRIFKIFRDENWKKVVQILAQMISNKQTSNAKPEIFKREQLA